MIIKIDGKACECEKGELLLQIAKRNGIYIPTLCHHEGIPGQGSCRVCLVEVINKGRSQIVASCVFPVEQEIEVLSNSERVRTERGIVLALLKLRAPNSDVIIKMCKDYDAPVFRRLKPIIDGDKCILCGLCKRACQSLGNGAIETLFRGTQKYIGTPYDEPSEDCIGCGSCAAVCPTQAIMMKDENGLRTIWGNSFKLVVCDKCGKTLSTEQYFKATNIEDCICDECKGRNTIEVIKKSLK
jgi:bidirectional [NiFe] hydrogenase diaphorase subunit